MRLICFEVKIQSSNVHASPIETEMHDLSYLEVLKHQERLKDVKKGTRDHFRGCETLSKVKPMYLEVKLKEATVERCV